MKVILIKDVAGLGGPYTEHEVAAGYGRNFLLPRGLALLATEGNLKKVKTLKSKAVAAHSVSAELARESLAGLAEQTFHYTARANEAEHLFAGISAKDLAEWLASEHRLNFAPEHLQLEHPIKALGEFKIPVQVGEAKAELKLVVEREEKGV
jgi:large subunit ribosomal protein L9